MMGRAFTLPSSALRYLIGHALAYGDHVVISSPWIGDVEVRLPLSPGVEARREKLAEAVRKLDTTVDVYVLPEEASNDYAVSRLKRLDNVTVTEVPDIHAKAVVTDVYVYVGSANITRGGLLTNKELCTVMENEYGDVESYVSEELDV